MRERETLCERGMMRERDREMHEPARHTAYLPYTHSIFASHTHSIFASHTHSIFASHTHTAYYCNVLLCMQTTFNYIQNICYLVRTRYSGLVIRYCLHLARHRRISFITDLILCKISSEIQCQPLFHHIFVHANNIDTCFEHMLPRPDQIFRPHTRYCLLFARRRLHFFVLTLFFNV